MLLPKKKSSKSHHLPTASSSSQSSQTQKLIYNLQCMQLDHSFTSHVFTHVDHTHAYASPRFLRDPLDPVLCFGKTGPHHQHTDASAKPAMFKPTYSMEPVQRSIVNDDGTSRSIYLPTWRRCRVMKEVDLEGGSFVQVLGQSRLVINSNTGQWTRSSVKLSR